MLTKAKEYLSTYFGYPSFRNGQETAIRYVLEGKNAVCIMPTGGGKSICYQIPALVLSGTTLVISPLISLMKDQVDALVQLGISATFINSSLTATEANKRIELAKQGEFKLLYVAPERLESPVFVEHLKQMTIPLIAVDEAHCISQWGHDFRPSYLHIHKMLDQFDHKPVLLALTATATPQVRVDICRTLNIEEANTVMTGFERKNLSFSVIKGQDRRLFLRDYIKKNEKESGIIYTATRKTVDQLYERLKKANINVARYHAGLSDHVRMEEQERFLQDEASVMIATSAFGMGIDKSNIRYVIHYQLPKDMESYYQEAGRAGRDGLDSECILLYSPQDVQIQRFLIEQTTGKGRFSHELEKLQQMVDYCHTESCLQSFILHYFGESSAESCGRCGNCMDERTSLDVTKEAQMVLSCMIRMGQRFGKTLIAQVLTGSKNKKIIDLKFDTLSTYGIMAQKSAKDVSEFIEFLISEECIAVEHGSFPTLFVTHVGKEVLMGNRFIKRKEQVQTKQIMKDDPLFEHLRALRKELADREHVPPFVIFSDQTLQQMCAIMPKTTEELLSVKGIGLHKQEKYGDHFIKAIVQFCETNPDRKPEIVTVSVEQKPTKKLVKDSHLVTYEMFKDGKTIDEIAKERGLTIKTVENHFILCAKEGIEINLAPFVPEEYHSLIDEAILKVGSQKLKPIKELLPNEVSYFMIKAYLCMHQSKMD